MIYKLCDSRSFSYHTFECETKHEYVCVCCAHVYNYTGREYVFLFRDDVCVFLFVCDE